MIIKNTFFLVFSGFIGGLGMLLLASGRFFEIDASLISAAIVFIAWQALGVTVSKMGADQIIFATCIGRDCSVDIRPVMLRKILPAATVFVAVSLTRYSPAVAALLFASIVLDCASILLQAKLSADLKVEKIFAASLLNYPAFLLILFFVPRHFDVSLLLIVACFCLSSLLRFAYLAIAAGTPAGSAASPRIRIEGSLTLGVYQGINYWIFRSGKIAAGLSLFSGHEAVVSKLIFFWTAIELIDRLNLSVTPIVYRRMVQEDRGANMAMIGGISLLLASLFLAFYWFSSALLGMGLSRAYGTALVVNALLLFLPNYLIFRATRNADYAVLVGAGVCSCAAAGALFVYLLFKGDPLLALALYAPSQMLLLCVFTLVLNINPQRSRLHDKNVVTDSV
jgi:hypothetical protein